MDSQTRSTSDIAIIGMACRVPGARTYSELWRMLAAASEARTELSDADLRKAGVSGTLLDDPNYVKAGMFLPGMEQFDPGFFGFSPLDGRVLDPQHRHFLECSWEALEDAGCDPASGKGSIGVFAGVGHHSYLTTNLLTNAALVEDVGYFLLRHTGNDKDFLSTRVSYCFDLKGPSVGVQTACSTSLVAIHLAVQSLLAQECDLALAGGVTIDLPHRVGYLHKANEILSPDGHCRPFDASSAGTVFGSGVGVVVLKRLSEAISDRDFVHAVIKGSAINNDGSAKVSYLAPSVDGQAAAVAEALALADVDPRSVSYIETHGTGTQLGDPIEVAALTQAYGIEGGPRQYCGIGSIKSNIGHLDTAAGVAGLIKVVLAMRHRRLPATLHYTAANPGINFPQTPFFVVDSAREWVQPTPLRAGVSSLGVGGTNAHLVVEEAPSRPKGTTGRPLQLLMISARSDASLMRMRLKLAARLEDPAPDDAAREDAFADTAYSLATGRRAFRHRGVVVAATAAQASEVLRDVNGSEFSKAEAPASARSVAFMFAGGGAQYPGMGEGLYQSEAVYRNTIDECLAVLGPLLDFDLKALLFPPSPAARAQAAEALARPSRALPALFTTQFAQARLWQAWGIEPKALIGHSMGENTAACVAGVFSLRDALGLVALRGRLFETVPPGAMLSVELDEARIAEHLTPDLDIAAVNAPGYAVVSGPTASVAELERSLLARGIGCQRVRIDVAAHSAMLEPVLSEFGAYLRSIPLQRPAIPFVSNLTGTWATDDQAVSPDYWVQHLRRTVRFADGVGVLLTAGSQVLLEVGPGRTLTGLASLHPAKHVQQAIVTSLRHPEDATPDLAHMLGALGRLWQCGVSPDWDQFFAGQDRSKLPLSTYSFDHATCWVEPGEHAGAGGASAESGGQPAGVEQWLYQPIWQRAAKASSGELRGARVLLVASGHDLARDLRTALGAQGVEVRQLEPGAAFADRGDGDFQVRPDVADDWYRAADALELKGWVPTHIIHALTLDIGAGLATHRQSHDTALAFDSLMYLAQVAGSSGWSALRWLVLTPQSWQIAGEPVHSPLSSLVLGPVNTFSRELPAWRASVVDVEHPVVSSAQMAARILAELTTADSEADDEPLVALRGVARFVRRWARRTEALTVPPRPAVRRGGVYLITGGTGGLGLVTASVLARQASPLTLVLASRRAWPHRDHWNALVEQGAPEAAALKQIADIERLGATVLIEAVDVADDAALRGLATRLASTVGAVRGVIHAAGVTDDAPLLSKEIPKAHDVLKAKVRGTNALARVFDAAALEFFVLFSSSSAFSGLPGQVDYTAANAYLDSFAHWANDAGWPCTAINWPAWRGTGLADSTARGATRRLPAGRPTDHPMLERWVDGSDRRPFVTSFSVADHWVLREHRLKNGPALMPGFGFLEMTRAAWQYQHGDLPGVELTDVSFDYPFVVPDAGPKQLWVEISGEPSRSTFTLASTEGDERTEHARGFISEGPILQRRLDIEAIEARCSRGRQLFDDADHHPFLDFGARWASLHAVAYGEREALVHLLVAEAFQDELSVYRMHPALLDMAAAGAQALIDDYVPDEDLFVPVGCRRLVFNGRFPAKAFSHVVYKRTEGDHHREIALFDVTVSDASGRVFIEIVDFTMRRLSSTDSIRKLSSPRATTSPVLTRALELGIDPWEGANVLAHIMGRRLSPQTAVTPRHPEVLVAGLREASAPPAIESPRSFDPDDDPRIAQVEDVLRRCSAIYDVVVRSFDDGAARRLVAYFVPDPDEFVTQSEIRRFAREELPPELVPQQLVEMDELPRSATGVDRRGLVDPMAPVDRLVPPRTNTERAIAKIWQDALGMERVGITDNFFDLGGHSLLSVRVIMQTERKLGVRLTQATMVMGTLEQIARDLESQNPNRQA